MKSIERNKSMNMKYQAVFFLYEPAKSLYKEPQEVSQDFIFYFLIEN